MKSGSRKGAQLKTDEVIEVPPAHPDGNPHDSAPDGEAAGSLQVPGDSKSDKDRHQGETSHVMDETHREKEPEHEIDLEELRLLEEEKKKEEAVHNQLRSILPEIKSLKKWHVAALGDHYELCLHPDPIFIKHCILTKNGRLKYDTPIAGYKVYEEKADKRIRISDFSKIHKLRVDDWNKKVRDEELGQLQNSTLNSRFVDLLQLFTTADLRVLLDLTAQLDCFLFYRVLPAGLKEFKPYVNQCVHVVRRADLLEEMNVAFNKSYSFDALEIDKLIDSYENLTSDQAIENEKKEAEERKQRHLDKMRRIEEKRLRREAREKEEKERQEAELKAQEEAAVKEKEMLRSPAKAAAAAKLEKERLDREEKERQAAQDKSNTVTANSNNEAFTIGAVPTGDDLGGELQMGQGGRRNDDDIEEANLRESDIQVIDMQREEYFENPFAAAFFRISNRALTRRLEHSSQAVQAGWPGDARDGQRGAALPGLQPALRAQGEHGYRRLT